MSHRGHSLTVNAMKNQLPTGNEVDLALDGWTSTNNLPILVVVAYNMDRNWAVGEVQLAFDEVNILCFFDCNS